MQIPRRTHLRAGVLCAALLVTALTGCGGDTLEAGAAPEVPSALTESPSSPAPAPPAPVLPAPETGTPTLPPGDPGNDPAPSSPAEQPELPPRTDVPEAAMLDTVTVGAIAGGQWSSAPVPSETCAAPRPGTTATTRTAALTSGSSILIQTVSVHQNAEDAEAAVSAGARRLTACGWTVEDTDAVGEAAVQMRRGTGPDVQRVVLVALEGVTAALVATGRELAAPEKMSALVDVAVNTSCAAAADGCH